MIGAVATAAGRGAADWWVQTTIGGPATDDHAAAASRIQDGILEVDPEVLDTLPFWLEPGEDTTAEPAADDWWREAAPSDTPDWEYLTDDQQDQALGVYRYSYADAVYDRVLRRCQAVLAAHRGRRSPTPSTQVGVGAFLDGRVPAAHIPGLFVPVTGPRFRALPPLEVDERSMDVVLIEDPDAGRDALVGVTWNDPYGDGHNSWTWIGDRFTDAEMDAYASACRLGDRPLAGREAIVLLCDDAIRARDAARAVADGGTRARPLSHEESP